MATTVLITGAGGLIGSWLCRRLADEPVTFSPVRREEIDLLEPGNPSALMEQRRPDAVIHLAWCASGDSGYRHSAENERWVDATLELRQACVSRGVPLWATGTVVDRDSDPVDAYTTAKATLRDQLSDEISSGAIGWLRPHYVFDQAAGRPSLLAQALAAAERSEAVELQNPDLENDFVHVSDVAAAIVLALQTRTMGALDIGSGTTRRVADVVDSMGVQWRRATTPSPAGSTKQSGVADVAWLSTLGWTPQETDAFFANGGTRR